MSAMRNYLALDLGAESGRGLLGRFDGQHLTLKKPTAFPTARSGCWIPFTGTCLGCLKRSRPPWERGPAPVVGLTVSASTPGASTSA